LHLYLSVLRFTHSLNKNKQPFSNKPNFKVSEMVNLFEQNALLTKEVLALTKKVTPIPTKLMAETLDKQGLKIVHKPTPKAFSDDYQPDPAA